MITWLYDRLRSNNANTAAASVLRASCGDAVARWITEFGELVRSGIRPDYATDEQRVDARSVERNPRGTVLRELYPHESPWAHVLTERFLVAPPAVDGRRLEVAEVIAAAPHAKCLTPGVERDLLDLGYERPAETIVAEVRSWIVAAVRTVDEAGEGSDMELGRVHEAWREYEAFQRALLTARRSAAERAEALAASATNDGLAVAPVHTKEQRSDADRALATLRRSAIHGNAWTRMKLGKAYLSIADAAGTEREGVLWMERAAAGGSAEAQYEIGRMYECGRYVSHDPIVALAWLRCAADGGHRKAGGAARRLGRSLAGWQLATADWLSDRLPGGAHFTAPESSVRPSLETSGS